MGKLSRTKGHSFERTVAIAFRCIFPNAIRQLEYQFGGGIDLANLGRLNVQCKRGKKYHSLSAIDEARDGQGIPVLVTQGDRKETLVALPLLDFLAILKDPSHAYKGKEHDLRKKVEREENRDPENDHGSGTCNDPSCAVCGEGLPGAG